LLIIFGFEVIRGKEIKGAMKALRIIEAFDVIEDGGACLVVIGKLPTIEQFPFEGAPEAFHGGIVVTVSLTAHGKHQRGGLERVAEAPLKY